jgi:hypothetical protein
MKFDFDRNPARLAQTAKINDADADYRQSFAGHGKLILYPRVARYGDGDTKSASGFVGK